MNEAPTAASGRLLFWGLGVALAATPAVADAQPLVFYGQSQQTRTYESIADKNLSDTRLISGRGSSEDLELPFTFNYLGTNSDEVLVNSAGYITFDGSGNSFYDFFFSSSDALPQESTGFGQPNFMIAPFWNYYMEADEVIWAEEGTAPNRIVHIEWVDLGIQITNCGRTDGQMMISLFEADNSFEVSWGGAYDTCSIFGDEGVTGYEASGRDDDFFGLFDDCTETGFCTGSDFNNDLSGTVVRVARADDPELQIELGDFVRGALPGNSATGDIVFVNLGQQDATNVDARMYLSSDDQFDPAQDILIGTFTDEVATLANGRVTRQVTTNIPSTVPADQTFHLILEIDPNDEFEEIVEEDNVFITDDPIFGTGYDVELSGCELTDPANGINPGQSGTFTVTINNLGAPYTGQLGGLVLQLTASADTTPDTGDPSLGMITVPAADLQNLREYTVDVTGTLPSSGVPPGLYYPICRADPGNNVPELNRNDVNIYVATDEERFQSGADFAPTNVTFNTEVPMGTPLDLDITINSLAVPTTRSVEYRVYASTDDQFDPGGADELLGSGTADFRDDGPTELVEELSVTLRPDFPGGRYRVFVQTDPLGRIGEVVETNNVLLSGTAPGSTLEFLNAIDFAVENVQVTGGGVVQAGDEITVRYSILSDGLPFDGFVPYTVFASPGTTFNFGDLPIATGRAFIPASTTVPVSVQVERTIEIDPNLPPAPYNISVFVDPNDAFFEASEANNAGTDASPNPIITVEGSDLVADEFITERFAFASTPDSESTITAELRIENIGDNDAEGFRYVYVWSRDPSIRIDDEIAFESSPRNLAAGDAVTLVDEVPVPVRTSTDALFLGVAINFFNDVPDRRPENNNRIAAITDGPVPTESPDQPVLGRTAVTIVQPAPDYQVRIIVPGTAAAGGEQLAVTRSIANVGNAAGLNATYAYYLSENSVISVEDDVLLQPLGTTSSIVTPDAATGVFRTNLVVNSDDISVDFLRVPENISGGQSYFLGLVANPGFTQREVFTANNVDVAPNPIPVDAAPIQFVTRSFPRATAGVGYEVGVFAQGGPQPITWGLSDGSQLPPGLTLDSDAGIIEGEPTQEGRFDFTLRAFSGTAFADREFFIIVTPPTVSLEVITRSLPSGVANRNYDVDIIAIGGAPPYTWEIRNSDALPDGLEFTTEGRLFGIPLTPASESLLLRVTDSLGVEASRELPLRILNPNQTVQIEDVQLPSFVIDQEFPCDDPDVPAFTFTADGGIPGYRWSAVTDPPPGLELRSDGRFCGTPTQVGNFPFTIRVQDQFDPMDPNASREGLFDTALFIVEVDNDNELAVVGVALDDAERGTAYNTELQAIGGTEPYTWRLVEETGRLPMGMSISEDGRISGTPEEGGNFGFNVEVEDQNGRFDRQALQLTVNQGVFCDRPENEEDPRCVRLNQIAGDDGGCTAVRVSGGPLSVSSLLLLGLLGLMVRRRREDAPRG